MGFLEATAIVLGFITIWGLLAGLVWLVDNTVVKAIRGRSYINPEYWS